MTNTPGTACPALADTNERDHQYGVRVDGIQFMQGDASSIGVVFGNLDGRNFSPRAGHEQTHSQWLAYMAAEYKTKLESGMPIQMLSPAGAVLGESEIGNGIAAKFALDQDIASCGLSFGLGAIGRPRGGQGEEDAKLEKRITLTVPPEIDLPDCLRKLSAHHRGQIDDTLSNDESGSDQEIVTFWQQECGISEEAAKAAIAYRSSFFTDPFFQLFSWDTKTADK